MTYQSDFTLPSEIVEMIASQELGYVPELIRSLVNTAMQVERERYLQASRYERSEERRGHANGYKDKALKTRMGEITFHLQQNAQAYVPRKDMQSEVAEDIRTIFNAPDS
jgi:putative transposase